MANAQFDIKQINILKDILLRLHHGESLESVQKDFDQHFEHVSVVEILLIEQELISSDHGITAEDVMKLSSVHTQLYGTSINDRYVPEANHPGHPVQIFKDENTAFQSILNQINHFLDSLENEQQHIHEDTSERLKEQMSLLGEFSKHYNRKEKLFFPILERHGHYTPSRLMWKVDDWIRNLYKAPKRKMDKLPDIDVKLVRKAFNVFEKEFKEMIFQEESILLPIILSIFKEDDWLAIAKESDAFGYCFVEPEKIWVPEQEVFVEDEIEATDTDGTSKNLAFGGGYLTTKEANLILNNLPVEITFVDKNGVFKYFNEKVNSSEMLLVRTPISIGRNVANCHPPKSMKKVMKLVRELKSKQRSSESMWFKKGDEYIHITYKAVFDEKEEYLGILECVQDIQPFLELPREEKRGLSKLDE